jgi:hypothetical protein
MQDYLAWFSDNLTIDGWCGGWQLVDDMDNLYVKRITLNNM